MHICLQSAFVCLCLTVAWSDASGAIAAEGAQFERVCQSAATAVFADEVVSFIQLHSLSKQNGTDAQEQETSNNTFPVPAATPADHVRRNEEDFPGLIQSLHTNADNLGKAIATGHWEKWPWHSYWIGSAESAEEEDTDLTEYYPDQADMVVPSAMKFSVNHSHRRNHTHHHSGRHHNPLQRSHLDLTMIDHWCIDDMFLLTVASLMLIAFDVALSMSVREHTTKSHLVILFLTVVFSIVYFLCVRIGHDWHFAEGWLTGYIVEIAMSIENMFAIHLIFSAFKVPEEQVEFALTVSIYGALLLRLVFIVVLERLFTVGYVVDVVVGSVLILSGVLTLDDFDETGVESLYVTQLSKWAFGNRLQADYDEQGRVFVRGPSGERRFTLLFLVIWLVIIVDIMFAVDSVGSKTGHIRNTYLNLSSAVMAVFTLRASFFVIRDAAKTFHTLKYGICLVLLLMGIEMLASKWVAIGLGWICAGIGFIFVTSIFISVLTHVDLDDKKPKTTAKEVVVSGPPKKKSIS
mmetsp:Transcript_111824/g.203405  ORF Transcript_111824/g.203405 Transcript_111824/m.203405 type:complete len:520 (+) Transcript_111824:59-1618(+)